MARRTCRDLIAVRSRRVPTLFVEQVQWVLRARYREARIASGVPGTQLKDKILHYHFESAVLDALQAAGAGLIRP